MVKDLRSHNYRLFHITNAIRVKDHTVNLHGISDSSLEEISSKQLTHLQTANSISEFYKLQLHTPESDTQPPIPFIVLPLLSKHEGIFQELTTLPPPRTFNHLIHLEPGTGPNNVRPYRYPHSQKQTIEKLVSEMIQSGIVRHSNSAFLFSRTVGKEEGWYIAILCRL